MININKKSQYSIGEHNFVFALMMASAGMMGAYTFILRGGVFCNAQTANVVLMSIKFGQGDWMGGLYFLIPMSAYLLGALISELLTINLKTTAHFKWNTYFVAIEMLVLLGIGFIPAMEGTHHIVQILINFIASMQFTTFKRAEGIPMATTFCTNHIRQIGVSIANACHEKKLQPLKRGLIHFTMIVFFFVGGVILSLATKSMQEMSIFLCFIPLGITFIMLIYGDIRTRKTEEVHQAVGGESNGENANTDSSVAEVSNNAKAENNITVDNFNTTNSDTNITSDNVDNTAPTSEEKVSELDITHPSNNQ